MGGNWEEECGEVCEKMLVWREAFCLFQDGLSFKLACFESQNLFCSSGQGRDDGLCRGSYWPKKGSRVLDAIRYLSVETSSS